MKLEDASYLNPYIIAEIGVNHEGSLDKAIELIEQCARGGAHAAKFQTYKAETLASRHSPAYWDTTKEATRSQFELFKKYDTFEQKDYERLAEVCKLNKVDFLSTPFDLEAVEWLTPLMPYVKIASADITNLPLIRACARTGKPLLISTGAATYEEIQAAIDIVYTASVQKPNLTLLHCVLNYPTDISSAMLGRIRTLSQRFTDLNIGYSDHVAPLAEGVPQLDMAVLLGATVLEKHFTHDKSLPGNDHYHAMDEADLDTFCKKLELYRDLYEGESMFIEKQQMARQHARRSIVAKHPLKKGDVVTERDIIAKRPAHGVSPMLWDSVVGSKLCRDLAEDELLKDSDLEWRSEAQ